MLTLHRLLMIWIVMLFVACTSLLTGEPVMAGSNGFHDVRHQGNYRSNASFFNRRRFATYNKYYRYRLRNYGKYYNHYPNYGNSYLGDVYNRSGNNDSEITQDNPADMSSDVADTAESGNMRGWLLLANGEYSSALKTFSIQTRNEPNNGSLRVGYALAAAETGDLHKGVWAMRGALRTDPDSLYYLMLDENLQNIVKNLIHRYTDESPHTLATAAREFMIAALYYLLDDAESAGRILPMKDADSSTRNLGRLIQQMRSNQQARPG